MFVCLSNHDREDLPNRREDVQRCQFWKRMGWTCGLGVKPFSPPVVRPFPRCCTKVSIGLSSPVVPHFAQPNASAVIDANMSCMEIGCPVERDGPSLERSNRLLRTDDDS